MSTIKELNNKAWYRGLKVIYFVFVIFCYGLAIAIGTAASYDLYDERQSYVQYQENNRSLEEARKLENKNNVENQKLEEIQRLKDAGYTTEKISENFRVDGMIKLTRAEYELIYGEQLKVPSQQPNQPSSLLWIFLYVPGSLVLAWFISQLPKWTFYYIKLGTIRPEK